MRGRSIACIHRLIRWWVVEVTAQVLEILRGLVAGAVRAPERPSSCEEPGHRNWTAPGRPRPGSQSPRSVRPRYLAVGLPGSANRAGRRFGAAARRSLHRRGIAAGPLSRNGVQLGLLPGGLRPGRGNHDVLKGTDGTVGFVDTRPATTR